MAEQVRRERTRSDKKVESTSPDKSADIKAHGDEIIEGIDALLDEIDGVLEENAEEFVKSYVQRGGQ